MQLLFVPLEEFRFHKHCVPFQELSFSGDARAEWVVSGGRIWFCCTSSRFPSSDSKACAMCFMLDHFFYEATGWLSQFCCAVRVRERKFVLCAQSCSLFLLYDEAMPHQSGTWSAESTTVTSKSVSFTNFCHLYYSHVKCGLVFMHCVALQYSAGFFGVAVWMPYRFRSMTVKRPCKLRDQITTSLLCIIEEISRRDTCD